MKLPKIADSLLPGVLPLVLGHVALDVCTVRALVAHVSVHVHSDCRCAAHVRSLKHVLHALLGSQTSHTPIPD